MTLAAIAAAAAAAAAAVATAAMPLLLRFCPAMRRLVLRQGGTSLIYFCMDLSS
jgi:hypothetical protein